ncbi:MAG: hypothetical protein IT580_06005 [Verrucomicrobiales bacterium]|nr:hypothetical protein [Verrucomicrobiales bacterium]
MNTLATRKRLLILESDLHRAHLVVELSSISAAVRTLPSHYRAGSALGSALALLLAGRSLTCTTSHGRNPGTNPGWLPRLLRAGDTFSKLWRVFRPNEDPPTQSADPRTTPRNNQGQGT